MKGLALVATRRAPARAVSFANSSPMIFSVVALPLKKKEQGQSQEAWLRGLVSGKMFRSERLNKGLMAASGGTQSEGGKVAR